MGDIEKLLTSVNFWAVVGSIAAVIALIPMILAAARVIRRRSESSFLSKERSFYEKVRAERSPTSHREISPESGSDGLVIQYLSDVREGVEGLKELSHQELDQARDDVRALISELRKTHQALAEALEVFETLDVRRFFDGFESSRLRISALYNNGDIPAEVRTHCTKVENLVWKMTGYLPTGAVGIDRIRRLGHSVVVMDKEVIVPVMGAILERAHDEADLIERSIRAGNKKRAIWVKEKYWFEVQPMYKNIKDSLRKMDEAVSKL
jgi:hypothetical protein